MALIFGIMTCSTFYVTAFPIRPLMGVLSYSVGAGGGGGGGTTTYTYIMKNRLAVLFDGVADRERKHLGEKTFGIRGTRAPRRRIDRAFLGRSAFGTSPIEALGLSWLARGIEPGPMVPTMPPFSCRGGRSSPIGKNDKLNRHFMGNSRQSMLFNVNFVTFLKLHWML